MRATKQHQRVPRPRHTSARYRGHPVRARRPQPGRAGPSVVRDQRSRSIRARDLSRAKGQIQGLAWQHRLRLASRADCCQRARSSAERLSGDLRVTEGHSARFPCPAAYEPRSVRTIRSAPVLAASSVRAGVVAQSPLRWRRRWWRLRWSWWRRLRSLGHVWIRQRRFGPRMISPPIPGRVVHPPHRQDHQRD